MDEQTRKELEQAHKKAMEGINAFNKAMHENVDALHDYLGVPKKEK